jgi:deoxyinosine 3'endonuclease (endonuclease V)
MLAHGFSVAQIVKLVRLGLATATAERVVASARTVGVAKLRLTAKGRQARRSSWSPLTPGRSHITRRFEFSER